MNAVSGPCGDGSAATSFATPSPCPLPSLMDNSSPPWPPNSLVFFNLVSLSVLEVNSSLARRNNEKAHKLKLSVRSRNQRSDSRTLIPPVSNLSSYHFDLLRFAFCYIYITGMTTLFSFGKNLLLESVDSNP